MVDLPLNFSRPRNQENPKQIKAKSRKSKEEEKNRFRFSKINKLFLVVLFLDLCTFDLCLRLHVLQCQCYRLSFVNLYDRNIIYHVSIKCMHSTPSLHGTTFICLVVCWDSSDRHTYTCTNTLTHTLIPIQTYSHTHQTSESEREKIPLLIGPIDKVRLISPTLTHHHRFMYTHIHSHKRKCMARYT